jgi:hypothetical protein
MDSIGVPLFILLVILYYGTHVQYSTSAEYSMYTYFFFFFVLVFVTHS